MLRFFLTVIFSFKSRLATVSSLECLIMFYSGSQSHGSFMLGFMLVVMSSFKSLVYYTISIKSFVDFSINSVTMFSFRRQMSAMFSFKSLLTSSIRTHITAI